MARPKVLKDSERKSARISLLLTPQMVEDMTTLAQFKRISVNDLFATLAAQVIKKNRPVIDEIQAVMSKVESRVELSLDLESE